MGKIFKKLFKQEQLEQSEQIEDPIVSKMKNIQDLNEKVEAVEKYERIIKQLKNDKIECLRFNYKELNCMYESIQITEDTRGELIEILESLLDKLLKEIEEA